METVVYVKRENQNPVPVRLKTIRQNGQWLAVAEIQTRTGPVRLTAMAAEKTVADLVKRGVAKLPPEMATGADVFSSIAKLTQSQAAQNVLKQAQSVVKHPLFMTALSFIPGFGPAMQTMNKATNAVKAAQSLMGRARQGDQKAQQSVNVIANSAKKGSKKGSVLMALLQAADGAIRSMFSGGNDAPSMEVSDIAAQFAAGSWSPPWTAASSGNSWTPPWGNTPSSQPPAAQPPQTPTAQLPPSAQSQPGHSAPPAWPAQGWPMQPPQNWPMQPPMQPPQNWPMQPPQNWSMQQPPQGSPMQQQTPPWRPAGTPNSQPPYPYPWPWFPRSTPKC